ncbi:hypothetical protein BYT27DRAFT_7105125, partial [Phlegmacium glaucopus]
DEIGLVWAIVVKACSSAKCKECLLKIQTHAGQKQVLMLLMDMKVCWSSTYKMLARALGLKEFLEQFIFEIAWDETDQEKWQRLKALVLSDDKWKHVELLIKLLGHADDAQQAFSYNSKPCLHMGIPALEALHTAWKNHLKNPKFDLFLDGLEAVMVKVEEYCVGTATLHAYTFVMCAYFLLLFVIHSLIFLDSA